MLFRSSLLKLTIFDVCGMIKHMNEQYNLWILDPKKIDNLKITDIPEFSAHSRRDTCR